MMGTEIFKIDASWAEKWTKTRVSFLSAPTVGASRHQSLHTCLLANYLTRGTVVLVAVVAAVHLSIARPARRDTLRATGELLRAAKRRG